MFSNLHRTILLDVDGVLLNWFDTFTAWMAKEGFPVKDDSDVSYDMAKRFGINKEESFEMIRRFNDSAYMGFLPAMPDAPRYIEDLKNLGFRFRAVTSVSECPYAAALRRLNLKQVYGNVFDDVVCLPLGACKKDELMRQRRLNGDNKMIFIEDSLSHARTAVELGGFIPILLAYPYNVLEPNEFPRIKRFFSWRDIFSEIKCLHDKL